MLTKQEWWTAVGLTVVMFAGIALIGSCSTAAAQETAPYAVTGMDPLVIERDSDAPDGTVAFLESTGDDGVGRTGATRAGFDFACTSGGGAAYTGIVYRVGDGSTMRAAIENPGGHLSAPVVYGEDQGNPWWDWSRITVYDRPIAPDVHSFGVDTDCVGGRS